jgi:hypothetical protein
MNIRFHFHDTNGNACCKVQDMSTSAYVHLYCTSGYDLPAYETTFINHTGGSDTNVFQISTPMAQLDGTNYSIELYEDSSVVTPNVSYSNGIANVSFDTVSSDVSFTLRINNIGNNDYMLDEPYINPDAQFITPTYTGFNLMAQSLGTDYDNIQNNTQTQQVYSTDGTVVRVSNVVNIVLTVQANEGTPYKVKIDGNIYYLDSNNQVTVQAVNYFQLDGVYDANDAKYLNVDGDSFGACNDYYISISSDTTITVDDLTSAGHTHYSPNYDMPVTGKWTDGNNILQTLTGDGAINYNGNYYDYNYDTSTDSMYYIEREGCDYEDGTISDTFVYDSTNDEWTYEGNTFTRVQPENTIVFTGATITGAYLDCDNGEGYVWYQATNNTIQFDDGDFWSMKKLTTTNGDIVSSVDYVYNDGTTGTNTITNPEDQIAGHYEDSGSHSITINSVFPYAIPDLSGRRFGNAENEESWYFTAQNAVHYQNGCGEGATSLDLNITAWIWNPNGWPQIGWNMQTDDNIVYYYDPAEDKFYDNYTDYYPEIYYDPCTGPSQPDLTGRYYFDSTNNYVIYFTNNQSLVYGPCGEGTSYWFDWGYTDHWILQVIIGGNYENFDYYENDDVFEYNGAEFTYSSTDPCGGPGPQPTEKRIYLCDNSGAHLAEMTNTGSTWSVSGAFTSGMYSIRATVEGEYDDAWFKFYQTSGDNRVFVGAGDDPSFEDIGTYIMIDDILTSFSLTEDQETGYYVVSYENTGAMTVSMVDTIVNSYIGDLNIPTDTSDLTNGAGFITVSDVSAMSYITMTDVQSLGYIDQTTLDAMSYVDQTSLSSMSYVDNSYLSSYMNAVVGDINSILQTI